MLSKKHYNCSKVRASSPSFTFTLKFRSNLEARFNRLFFIEGRTTADLILCNLLLMLQWVWLLWAHKRGVAGTWEHTEANLLRLHSHRWLICVFTAPPATLYGHGATKVSPHCCGQGAVHILVFS